MTDRRKDGQTVVLKGGWQMTDDSTEGQSGHSKIVLFKKKVVSSRNGKFSTIINRN